MKEYLDAQAAARDEALEALEVKRGAHVGQAREIAIQIARRRGRVTSTEVFEALTEAGVDLKGIDKRFMGAVFRPGKGFWRLDGFQPWGSHKRRVAVWRLVNPAFDDLEGSWSEAK